MVKNEDKNMAQEVQEEVMKGRGSVRIMVLVGCDGCCVDKI
jgi:uncharacterized metal-binding protein